MVDFDIKQPFPTEAFLQASRRPSRFGALRSAIQGIERGITKGFEFAELADKSKRRRALAKVTAQLGEVDEETGKTGFQKSDELLGVKTGTSAVIAAEEGGITKLTELGIKAKASQKRSAAGAIGALKAQLFRQFKTDSIKLGPEKARAKFIKENGLTPDELLRTQDFTSKILGALGGLDGLSDALKGLE